MITETLIKTLQWNFSAISSFQIVEVVAGNNLSLSLWLYLYQFQKTLLHINFLSNSLNLFPVLVRIPTLRCGYLRRTQLVLLRGSPEGRRFANAPLFRSLFPFFLACLRRT
ncbi:MAG: hypothetical protein QNJ49_14100 [Mastigocoleus sp. MO_167.B18]|uniref:hypothetical protein n=1 Tax=Mastigocoleus sp. MO_188.B34 TaxID=3036635 RepID=UPI0026108B78|nr:hypothetical protein [Mastigocoleus sp. MO_188.B34]MDJ0696750.1 hypothetical protein [Mastigocoleus sp. MO_188.B34]MDJ0774531.1 hypothetical protein [Mastigocoleus sp. MO_167.B18]